MPKDDPKTFSCVQQQHGAILGIRDYLKTCLNVSESECEH